MDTCRDRCGGCPPDRGKLSCGFAEREAAACAASFRRGKTVRKVPSGPVRWTGLLMLAGVLWLTAVADVRAQGMRSPLGDGAGSPHACWGEQILASPDVGLTPEQMERIRQLNARCRSEMTHPESALAEQKRKLRQLWLEPEPAPERIEPLQRSVRTLRGEIREKRSRHRGDILETLTPEQRDQLTPYGRPAHRHPAR